MKRPTTRRPCVVSSMAARCNWWRSPTARDACSTTTRALSRLGMTRASARHHLLRRATAPAPPSLADTGFAEFLPVAREADSPAESGRSFAAPSPLNKAFELRLVPRPCPPHPQSQLNTASPSVRNTSRSQTRICYVALHIFQSSLNRLNHCNPSRRSGSTRKFNLFKSRIDRWFSGSTLA